MRLGYNSNMTTRGVNFLHAWLDAHMAEFNYPPDDCWGAKAKALADKCRDDALATGIYPNEIEEEVGSVEVLIFRAMQSDGHCDVAEKLLAFRKMPHTIH